MLLKAMEAACGKGSASGLLAMPCIIKGSFEIIVAEVLESRQPNKLCCGVKSTA